MSDDKDLVQGADEVLGTSPEKESVPTDEPVVTEEKKLGVVLPEDYYGPIENAVEKYRLVMIADRISKVREAVDEIDPKKIPGSEAEIIEYLDDVSNALKHAGLSTDRLSPFTREDADWGRTVEHEGQQIGMRRPNIRSSSNMNLDQAILRARAAAKLGTLISVPLYHSGIWLVQKAAPDAELLDLERRIVSEKTRLGRSTTGLTFSSAGLYMNMHLVNSALSYVYSTTSKASGISALKQNILVTDIPLIVHGYASAIWPDGYKLIRPCVANTTGCTHREERLISIPKLLWVDRRALSPYQKNFMLAKDKVRTAEELQTYREHHVVSQTRVVKITDDLSMRMQVPTIAQAEEAGLRWINNIVDSIDEAFGERLSTRERDTHIVRVGRAKALAKYTHWVGALIYSDGAEVTDPAMIEEVLSDLSGSKETRVTTLKYIEEFIASVSIAAIGVPDHTCPSCGKSAPDEDRHPRIQEILQQEINEIFFTLVTTKLELMLSDD